MVISGNLISFGLVSQKPT